MCQEGSERVYTRELVKSSDSMKCSKGFRCHQDVLFLLPLGFHIFLFGCCFAVFYPCQCWVKDSISLLWPGILENRLLFYGLLQSSERVYFPSGSEAFLSAGVGVLLCLLS